MNGRIFAAVPAGMIPTPRFPTIDTCPACGMEAVPYSGIPLSESDPPSTIAPHPHTADARAVRKRICFGRPRAC